MAIGGVSGAMCHDASKPVTDLTVTNKDRTTTWSPITEDLYLWANRNAVEAYFLDWREGRNRQHTALSLIGGERIIGNASLAWIAEVDTELVVWLMESLSCNPGPNNMIYDLVAKSDQTSVERDLKTHGGRHGWLRHRCPGRAHSDRHHASVRARRSSDRQ
ncbi:MAG: TraI domain-containing protein [Sulfuritalea sp.]|nr:TraI domain-containing protein [Sulfuritalea sp.]